MSNLPPTPNRNQIPRRPRASTGAITTIGTVGYRDLSPTTTEERLLAAVVMLVGSGFAAIRTGAIADRFLARELERETRYAEGDVEPATAEVTRRLERMRAQA